MTTTTKTKRAKINWICKFNGWEILEQGEAIFATRGDERVDGDSVEALIAVLA
jgi:hypothetical protein